MLGIRITCVCLIMFAPMLCCPTAAFVLQIECRLCLTLHNNEGNYLAHTQVRQQRQWQQQLQQPQQ